MKKVLKCLILSLFLFSPFSYSLVILQYHHISDSTPKSTSLSPDLFKQHLQYLKQNKFKVLPLKQVIQSLKSGQEIADKSVVITFDDGYRSIYTTAFPLLKKYGFPFTVFVNTAPLEKELVQFMNWQELRELTLNRGAIANHTVNHPHLIKKHDKVPLRKVRKKIIEEVTTAQKLLDKHLDGVLKILAYPYGEFDTFTKSIVKSLGFVALGQHSGAVPIKPDLQAIPRFPFGGDYGDIDDFIIKVNSLSLSIESVVLLDNNHRVLSSHLLKNENNKPRLLIVLNEKSEKLNLQCYSSNGKKLIKQQLKKGFLFSPTDSVDLGRSRYNCTSASSYKGRFYWFSQPWLRANELNNYF